MPAVPSKEMNSLPSPKPPLLRRPLFWIAASALTGAAALPLWQTQGEIQAALGLFALAALAGAAWTVARQSTPAASLAASLSSALAPTHLHHAHTRPFDYLIAAPARA